MQERTIKFHDGDTPDLDRIIEGLHKFTILCNAALFNEWSRNKKYEVSKSWKHADGDWCSRKPKEWFAVTAKTPFGIISNYFPAEDWDLFKLEIREKSPLEFHGHKFPDVLETLRKVVESQ